MQWVRPLAEASGDRLEVSATTDSAGHKQAGEAQTHCQAPHQHYLHNTVEGFWFLLITLRKTPLSASPLPWANTPQPLTGRAREMERVGTDVLYCRCCERSEPHKIMRSIRLIQRPPPLVSLSRSAVYGYFLFHQN